MTKTRGITWLEQQTGERLDPPPDPPPAGRHLSIRVPAGLLDELEALAREQGETVSQAARRLLAESLRRRQEPDQAAIDAAIATLEGIRSRLGPPAA